MALAKSLQQKMQNRDYMRRARKSRHTEIRAIEVASQARRAARMGPSALRRERLRYNLWHQYRMPLEVFDQLVETQQGACAICRNGPKPGERLHVDHDHQTGRVRGLLCRVCNQGMIAVDRITGWPEKAMCYAALHEELQPSH